MDLHDKLGKDIVMTQILPRLEKEDLQKIKKLADKPTYKLLKEYEHIEFLKSHGFSQSFIVNVDSKMQKDDTLVRDIENAILKLQREEPHLLEILLDKKIEPYWSVFVQGSKNFWTKFYPGEIKIQASKEKNKNKKEILKFYPRKGEDKKGEYMAKWGDKYAVYAMYEPPTFTIYKLQTVLEGRNKGDLFDGDDEERFSFKILEGKNGYDAVLNNKIELQTSSRDYIL